MNKRLKIILAFATIAGFCVMVVLASVYAISAHAGMWERLTTSGNQTIAPVAQYNVKTAGWNVRVYEWKPAFNPDYRCVLAAGTKIGGVSCYPVPKPSK